MSHPPCKNGGMKHIPPVSRIFKPLARALTRIFTRLARLAPTKKRGPEQLDFLSTLNASPGRDIGGEGTR